MRFDSTLTNKISSIVGHQLPEFVQSEHEIFINFIKSYYQFLESAELVVELTIGHIAQETVSSNFILDEKGQKIVTEVGSGTTGKFMVNETVTRRRRADCPCDHTRLIDKPTPLIDIFKCYAKERHLR